jgi:two-component system, response regulator
VREPRVLLVEDNPDDVDLTLLAFKLNEIPARIDIARDGAEALDFLFSTGPHSGEPLPELSVILLDLKLPRVDGLEVLRRVRADDRTRNIPVVILSTSKEETDLRRTAEIGIDRYVRKPINFDEFRRATRQLAQAWLGSGREEAPA